VCEASSSPRPRFEDAEAHHRRTAPRPWDVVRGVASSHPCRIL